MDQYRQLLDDVDVDDELLVCAAGFEPATPCAQDTCATTALRTEVVGGVRSRVFMMARIVNLKMQVVNLFGAGSGNRTQLNAVWKTGVPPWAYPQIGCRGWNRTSYL